MGNLLSKFENIEVNAASRLSAEDAAFCSEEQKIYAQAHKLYSSFSSSLSKAIKAEIEAREAQKGKVSHSWDYCQSHGKGSSSDIMERIEEIQTHFIQNIVYYFTSKYNITLESDVVYENCGLTEPKYDYHMPNSEWKKLKEAHMTRISRLLHFDEIIDEILLQLDGLTFVDKAIEQIKDDARGSVQNRHIAGKLCYTLDKKTIRFTEPFSRLEEHHRKVLRALWHYDSGLTTLVGSNWEKELVSGYSRYGEDKRVERPYEFDGRKVCKFRYYKSGRWDVTFSKVEYADTFVREYLGY